MKNWKEALWLAMFEIKNASTIRYLIWLSILILLVIFMVPTTYDYFEKPHFLMDIIFLFGIVSFP